MFVHKGEDISLDDESKMVGLNNTEESDEDENDPIATKMAIFSLSSMVGVHFPKTVRSREAFKEKRWLY